MEMGRHEFGGHTQAECPTRASGFKVLRRTSSWMKMLGRSSGRPLSSDVADGGGEVT